MLSYNYFFTRYFLCKKKTVIFEILLSKFLEILKFSQNKILTVYILTVKCARFIVNLRCSHHRKTIGNLFFALSEDKRKIFTTFRNVCEILRKRLNIISRISTYYQNKSVTNRTGDWRIKSPMYELYAG